MAEYSGPLEDAVAIVGMACRLPAARDVDEFWRNLKGGREAILPFSDKDLETWGVSRERSQDPQFVSMAAVVAGAEEFDAEFFGFTPRDAQATDPQFRVFLECCWQALELAGAGSGHFRPRTGVFAGCGGTSYGAGLGHLQEGLGQGADFLSSLVSYKLDLRGPSLTVQTACSSSLVAVHLAVRSLLERECDLALGGGVSIPWPQRVGHLYTEGGIYSADGHCRAYDAAANGTVGANGAAVVVLKRLAEALEDGDPVRAVVRGSAVNNDGAAKVGFTAPSVQGQAAVIREALGVAGVSADSIGYVEGHGTGTPLGDPIEVVALTEAFRVDTQRRGYCGLGSVKSNLGHLDAAAGVTGLIKAALCLEHGYLAPTLHFKAPNPKLALDSSPFFVVAEGRPWRRGETPRRAAVSSFGMGGTNVHLILEEAPERELSGVLEGPHILPLSGRNEAALEAQQKGLAEFLRSRPEVSLADVAHTLQVGRQPQPWRRAVLVTSVAEAVESLTGGRRRGSSQRIGREGPPVAFLFPGQGARLAGRARELYEQEAVFRRHIDRGCEVLQGALGRDLRALLMPTEDGLTEAEAQLRRTSLAQPALLVFELALARLWIDWGVKPNALLGHSLGEYTAACLAGVFSLEDGLAMVAERGRLMEGLPPGSMLAVALAAEEVLRSLSGELSLAAVNGPRRCVVSGPREAVAAYGAQLTAAGTANRPLATDRAFHSSAVEPMTTSFGAFLRSLELRPPRIPMVSNVTGTWLSDDEATSPDYWLRHLRQPVLFSDGLGTLLRTTHRQLLEVGPEATLTSLARPIVKDQGGATPMASLGPWQEGSSSRRGLLAALAELWQSGVEPAWPKLAAAGRRSKISLPTYPFERRSYGRPAPMSAVSAINVPTALAPTAPDAAVPVLEFPIGPPRAVQVPGHASPEPPAAGLETLIYRQLEVIEAQLETLSAVGRRGAEAGGSPLV